jgi:hypothetical protein
MAENTPGGNTSSGDAGSEAAEGRPSQKGSARPTPRNRAAGADARRKKPAGETAAGKSRSASGSPGKRAKDKTSGSKAAGGKGTGGRRAGAKGAGGTAKKTAGSPSPAPAGGRRPADESRGGTPVEAASEQTAVTVASGDAAVTDTAVAGEAAATIVDADAAQPDRDGEAAVTQPGGGTAVTRALAPVGRVLVSRRAPRVRAWFALILVIMAVVAIVVSVVALWSRDLVFDTSTYVKTVAPVADDPEVRHAVSVYVADKAIEATDLSARIEKALPSDAKILAAPLTNELRGFLVGQIDKFLGTKLAKDIWVDINRFAHEQLISALQDESRYVSVGEHDVKLNFLPLVAVALEKLEAQIPRLLGRDVQLPQIDPATAPQDIRTLLQDALGRPLPADFGSITVLRGSQGYEAKQALRLFNDLVVLVVIVAVVLVLAAVLVSPRRLRTALQLGLGAVLGFVVARVIEVQLEKAIVGAVKSPGGGAVARSIVSSAIGSLNSFFVWVAIAGVIVTVAAFLAGRPAWTAAMGRGFAKLFGVASDLSAPDTAAGRWMAAHLDVLRIGGVAVAVVVLLLAASSLTAVIVTVVALVIYELALTAYAVGLPVPKDDGTPGKAV